MSRKLAFLSILPMLSFAWAGYDYLQVNTLPELLWHCNVNNIVLALGLLWRKEALIAIATISIINGVPLWIYDDYMTGVLHHHAIGTHVMSTIIGLYALRQIGKGEKVIIWTISFWFLMQYISYLFTPVDLNINMAHKAYSDPVPGFDSFWIQWIGVSLYGTVLAMISQKFIHSKIIKNET